MTLTLAPAQASLLGFAVFKVLPQSSLFSNRPLTVHENIVLQTTAVATGTLPLAAGLVGVRRSRHSTRSSPLSSVAF